MGDETLAKYPGLSARENGVWYVRKRVPVDLVELDKRSSLRISLDTADLRTAKKRYPFKLAEIEAHFDALRNQLQTSGAIKAASAAGNLERLRYDRIEAIVSDWWRRREAARRSVIAQEDNTETLIEGHHQIVTMVEDADFDALSVSSGLDSEVVRATADALLVEAGFAAQPHRVGRLATRVAYPVIDRNTPNYRHLCDLVTRGLVAEAALAKDRILGRSDAPHDSLFNPEGRIGAVGLPDRRDRLTDLFRDYAAERALIYGDRNTEKKCGFVFRVMEEVLGREKRVSALTRADCVSVHSFLKRIPANPSKRFAKLTLTELVAKADVEGLKPRAPNTVATYMQTLAAALRWAKDAGWDVNVSLRDLVGSREAMVKRRGFRTEELDVLFASLTPYRQKEPAKFWVPALALFTGARAGEICQLRVEDVVDVEGVSSSR